MMTVFVPEMMSKHTPEAVFRIELGTRLDQAASVVVVALPGTGHAPGAVGRVGGGDRDADGVLAPARALLPADPPAHPVAIWRAGLWIEARLKQPAGAIAFAAVVLLVTVPNLSQDGTSI